MPLCTPLCLNQALSTLAEPKHIASVHAVLIVMFRKLRFAQNRPSGMFKFTPSTLALDVGNSQKLALCLCFALPNVCYAGSTAAHSTYSIMEYGTDPELHGKHDSHRVMAALGSTAVLPKLYHKSDDVHNDYEDEEDQSGKVVWKKNDTPVENLNDARLAVLSNGKFSGTS